MTGEELNKLIDSIARRDEDSLLKLYDEYRIAFYCTAFAVLKNEKDARAVATEAFRRIRSKAYRFDEALNGEYWLFDVLYKLASNKYLSGKDLNGIKDTASDGAMGYEPEVYIKLFSGLGVNEIASLTGKKKNAVKDSLKNTEAQFESIRSSVTGYIPDFRDDVIAHRPTGIEEFSEEEVAGNEFDSKKQTRQSAYKRVLAVIFLILFVCGAVFGIVHLVKNNFGSDIMKQGPGDDVVLQFNNTIAVTEMNGAVYFCGEKDALYKKDMDTGNTVKLSDDSPKELLNDGTYVYYRNHNDGYMYRIDADGANKIKLCDVPGAAMEIYGDWMYFSTTGGIYRVPLTGGTIETAELIFDNTNDVNLYCVDMEVDALGNVFFASGIGKGVHHVTEYQGSPSVDGIFTDEAYTIMIDGDMLYFDYKEANGRILLFCFDLKAYLNNESETRIQPKVVSNAQGENIVLSTGAFYVHSGIIYYVGDADGVSTLYKLDEQRKVSTVAEVPSLYKNNLVISDIYISDNWAYCFSADGKSNGKRIFFVRALNTNENVTIYES